MCLVSVVIKFSRNVYNSYALKPNNTFNFKAQVNLRTSWCHAVKSFSAFYIPQNDGSVVNRWLLNAQSMASADSRDKNVASLLEKLIFLQSYALKKGKVRQTNLFVA